MLAVMTSLPPGYPTSLSVNDMGRGLGEGRCCGDDVFFILLAETTSELVFSLSDLRTGKVDHHSCETPHATVSTELHYV